MQGIGWKVGNGRKVKFWEDCWVPNYGKLGDHVTRSIPASMSDDMVSECLRFGYLELEQICSPLTSLRCFYYWKGIPDSKRQPGRHADMEGDE